MRRKGIYSAWLLILIFLLGSCLTLNEEKDLRLVASYQKNSDGTISFQIILRNEGLKPLTLVSGSSQIYDIEVYANIGQLVWNWAYDKAFLLVLTELTLQPGQEKAFHEKWDLRTNGNDPAFPGPSVKPGSYKCRVRLVTKPGASYVFEMNI